MAKTSSVEKNERRRRLVAAKAGKRKALKSVIMNKELPIEERFRAQLKLSRIAMRDLGSVGLIPGLVKSSW